MSKQVAKILLWFKNHNPNIFCGYPCGMILPGFPAKKLFHSIFPARFSIFFHSTSHSVTEQFLHCFTDLKKPSSHKKAPSGAETAQRRIWAKTILGQAQRNLLATMQDVEASSFFDIIKCVSRYPPY